MYVQGAEDECWPWTGRVNEQGYGIIYEGGLDGGRRLRAHRAMYELHVGPIADGLTLDHLCHTRAVPDCADGPTCAHRRCVNPAHLEPVTKAENLRRGEPRNRTHCPHGHEKTPENIRVNKLKNGGVARACRVCERERRSTESYRVARQAQRSEKRAA